MNDQLALLPAAEPSSGTPPPGEPVADRAERGRPIWQLDERTRQVGRQGVASAREALRQAAGRTAA